MSAKALGDASALTDEHLAARLTNWAASITKGNRIGSTERRILAVLLTESANRIFQDRQQS